MVVRPAGPGNPKQRAVAPYNSSSHNARFDPATTQRTSGRFAAWHEAIRGCQPYAQLEIARDSVPNGKQQRAGGMHNKLRLPRRVANMTATTQFGESEGPGQSDDDYKAILSRPEQGARGAGRGRNEGMAATRSGEGWRGSRK